jgi:hypothetical protein
MQEDTKKLRKAYNDGDEHYDEMMDKLVKDYDLSTKDIRRLEKQMASSKESQFDPSAFMFEHLEWPQMRDRLKAMTPDEREYYLQHISKDKRQKWYREEDSESSNP